MLVHHGVSHSIYSVVPIAFLLNVHFHEALVWFEGPGFCNTPNAGLDPHQDSSLTSHCCPVSWTPCSLGLEESVLLFSPCFQGQLFDFTQVNLVVLFAAAGKGWASKMHE